MQSGLRSSTMVVQHGQAHTAKQRARNTCLRDVAGVGTDGGGSASAGGEGVDGGLVGGDGGRAAGGGGNVAGSGLQ
jgi:hypothetical protein